MKSENDVTSPASRYSSCGDSDFERYCSANSALGTPSVCGSSIAAFNDFSEFELGGGSIERNGERLKRLDLFGNESDDRGFVSWSNEAKTGSLTLNCDLSGDDGLTFERNSDRGVDILSPVDGLDEGLKEFEGRDRDDGGFSSRDEHSEGEDSMYGYGSDGQDTKGEMGYYRSTGYSVEAKSKDENPLQINSSVAFGSDDWDSFVQESGGFLVPLDDSSVPVNVGELVVDIPVLKNRDEGYDELDLVIDRSVGTNDFPDLGVEEDVKDIPVASCQVQSGDDVIEFTKSAFTTPVIEKVYAVEKEDTSHIPYTKDHVQEFQEKIEFRDGNHSKSGEEIVNKDSSTDHVSSRSTAFLRNTKLNLLEESRKNADLSTLKNNTRMNPPGSNDRSIEHPKHVHTEVIELNEVYDEVVDEMEKILLASNESPGARFTHSNRALQSHLSLPMRDGGSSASTSGTDDAMYPFLHQPLRIDRVEVVGARQKEGDVSLGERLVGVKEHTLYQMRVWSGNDQWEVERRYRDFSTLHRRLKTHFAAQGWVLPASWAAVEKESLKIFGNASPDVVAERSVLIQLCLDSILHLRSIASSAPLPLIWFLCPQDSVPNSPVLNSENVSTLGKTVSLIVEIQPCKSEKQILEGQRYACAGCYGHFDEGKTFIRDFAQTLGWGKPRLCEYTGQLFCSSCHANDTAVLPARVLHNWDFTRYPVCQFAKSYLDSIHEQPMLCVSAVNPFLFSKVPTLFHVMSIRRKIVSILLYVRCPFRGSINRGLGSRRYLLESNDFFALRDLIDLSKGAFAVLSIMVETVLKKIVEHITEHCLWCCDAGVPCGARQACNDPSSLIFPFQEGDVEKCPSCSTEFHKACFRKLTDCHCGAHLRGAVNSMGLAKRLTRGESSRALDFLGKGLGSGLSVGFLSGLFGKGKTDNLSEHRDSDNVILMGSLPSTSL